MRTFHTFTTILCALKGCLQLGSFPVAGRLSCFLDVWEIITTDQWLLQIIFEGYIVPFIAPPPVMEKNGRLLFL